jgi:hypothetical protein
MSKLITEPKECGYRRPNYTLVGLEIGHICGYPRPNSLDNIYECNGSRKDGFPDHCPLKDGMLISKIAGMITTVKYNHACIECGTTWVGDRYSKCPHCCLTINE